MEHFIFSAEPLFASMPSGWTVLSDWGKDLLIALSTALFFLLVCIPFLLRKYWNLHIAGENWEVMTYRRSIRLTVLGALIVSVSILTVTTVREFLSPGAKELSGLHVEMNVVRQTKQAEQLRQEEFRRPHDLDLLRRNAILKLRDALKNHAQEHNGAFPASKEASGFGDLWLIPFGSGLQYDYSPKDTSLPLVDESELLPGRKFSLDHHLKAREVLP